MENKSHVVMLLWKTLGTMKIARCTNTCAKLLFRIHRQVMQLESRSKNGARFSYNQCVICICEGRIKVGWRTGNYVNEREFRGM
jgi:hypothetical protein